MLIPARTPQARSLALTESELLALQPAPAMPLPSSGVTPLLGPSRISSRPAVEHPPQPVESLPAPSVLESQQGKEYHAHIHKYTQIYAM
jgi:hypothetical protein